MKHIFLSLLLLASLVQTCLCQIPDFSKILNLHEGDSANITYLINNGIKVSDKKVVCWFPKDSLSEKQMNEVVSMLNVGIDGAIKFINAPLPWQLHPREMPFTFYFRFDKFISHASEAGFVSIPFWRIKEGKSPWLHEVMHIMLFTKTGSWHSDTVTEKEWADNMPLWLHEGLPDHISLTVSLKEKLPRFDVFSNTFFADIDSLFVEEMKSDTGLYIISFVGAKGVMPQLFTKDRMLYAPAFYHASHSFVKYIAENYDFKCLLTGISQFGKEHETIEQLTGKSMETLKKEWLNKLNTGKN